MEGINGNIGVGCRVFEFPLNIMEADHPVQLFSEVQRKSKIGIARKDPVLFETPCNQPLCL